MTIKDIAKLSGYGVGTVSRVLNNHPDVSERARKKILAVVESQGFEPNSNARHLKMQAPSSIAVLVKGTQNMLFADILERIQAVLRDHEEDVYVAYLDEDADEVQYAVQLQKIRRPKGLIFLGGDLEHFRRNFYQITVPCVLLTNQAADLKFSLLSSFATDDTGACEAVADFLVEKGHRTIGVLGGNLSAEQISTLRLNGIKNALARHQIAFDSEIQHEPCRFSMACGYQAAMKLLRRMPNITALFALGDVIALGAMRALWDLGLRIPQDISIIGYDDIASAQFCYPRLTTIRQDTAALAEKGVQALLRRLSSSEAPVHEIIPFQLCERESVQPYVNAESIVKKG